MFIEGSLLVSKQASLTVAFVSPIFRSVLLGIIPTESDVLEALLLLAFIGSLTFAISLMVELGTVCSFIDVL